MRMSNLKVLAAVLIAALGLMSIQVATAEHLKILNFFMHENIAGSANPSSFIIVEALAGNAGNNTVNTSSFGAAGVFDDSITATPDESSLEIARGRGFYAFVLNDTTLAGLEYLWTAEFNQASGITPGSTLTFKGLDRLNDAVREIAIVGGTGEYRFAHGWAVITTYSGNANSAVLNITANFKYGF